MNLKKTIIFKLMSRISDDGVMTQGLSTIPLCFPLLWFGIYLHLFVSLNVRKQAAIQIITMYTIRIYNNWFGNSLQFWHLVGNNSCTLVVPMLSFFLLWIRQDCPSVSKILKSGLLMNCGCGRTPATNLNKQAQRGRM